MQRTLGLYKGTVAVVRGGEHSQYSRSSTCETSVVVFSCSACVNTRLSQSSCYSCDNIADTISSLFSFQLQCRILLLFVRTQRTERKAYISHAMSRSSIHWQLSVTVISIKSTPFY